MESIRALLKESKLEAVAHRNTEMLKTVSEETPVSEAIANLKENNVLSVPVVDGKGSFSGCFSVTDVLKALVTSLKLEKERQSFDMKAEDSANALRRIRKGPVSAVMHTGDLWYVQGQEPTVMDAVKDMLQRRAVHHRLFTCETLQDTAPTGILSQSDIVRLVWDHKVELGELLHSTVEKMGLCAAAAETVPASDITLQVFVDMWRDRKSCMGIVDGKGDLVGNLSISDLRLLNDGNLDLLGKPVGAFLLAARGFAVPEGGDPDWSSALRAVPMHIVGPDTKFEKVLEALSVHRLHRVYVLDHKEHAIGIITLTDILRQLLPKAEDAPPCEGPGMGLPHSSDVLEEGAEGEGQAQAAEA